MQEDSDDGIVRSVIFEDDWKGEIVVSEYRGSGESLLEQVKDTLALTPPVLHDVLACELVEGFCDAGVVVYESLVEVSKTQ